MELTNKVYIPILDCDKIVEMMEWCEKNIEVNTWSWSYVDDSDLNSDVNFYFVHKPDAIVFSLRWL